MHFFVGEVRADDVHQFLEYLVLEFERCGLFYSALFG